MKKILKNKLGEISTSMLVGMIILVIGVVIISAVYYQIAWSPTIDRESCHTSVVLRASVPSLLESYVPLKCVTKKTCLSYGLLGGSCDDEDEDFEGVNGISKLKVKDITAVEKAIAGEVVDCWTMMGEGKVSLFSGGVAKAFGFENKIYSSCVICSRISVDPDLEKAVEKENIALANPYNYMATHKMPNHEVSYLDFITGGVKGQGVSFGGNQTVSSVDFSLISEKENRESLEEVFETSNYVKDKEFSELAVVFMQISATTDQELVNNWAMAAGTVGVASLWAAPMKTLSCVANPYCIGSILAVGGIAFTVGGINNWNNQAIAASYCGDIGYGEDARRGCSVVRVTKYDAKELKNFCGVVESLP